MSKLIPEHRDYLAAHAVDPELATSLGVRSLTGRPDVATLGEPWQNWANFPALLFPWTGPDGRTEYQVRPDNPTEDRSGRPPEVRLPVPAWSRSCGRCGRWRGPRRP